MAKRIVLQDFSHDAHDHAQCIHDAMATAEAICQQNGERFTPLRRTVLELIWSSHKPVKAYDLLSQLSESRERAAPPTVYRALDFLQQAGLVHKIKSLNAFVGCAQPARQHQGQFLICNDCGGVAELDDASLRQRIEQNASRVGFQVADETVEITGLCEQCR